MSATKDLRHLTSFFCHHHLNSYFTAFRHPSHTTFCAAFVRAVSICALLEEGKLDSSVIGLRPGQIDLLVDWSDFVLVLAETWK